MPQSSGALSALCVGSWNLGRLAGQLMALAAHSRRPGWRPGMSDKLPALTAPARSGHGWPLLLRGCPALGTPRLGSRVGKGRLDRYQSPPPPPPPPSPPHTHWPHFPPRSSPVPGRSPTAPPARQGHSPAPPGGRAPSVRVYARRGLVWMPLGLVGIFCCCCCCLDLNIFFCFVFCFVIFFVFLFLPFMVREGDGGRFHMVPML